MSRLPEEQNSRRGLLVDEHLRLLGADGVFALGDCTGVLPFLFRQHRLLIPLP